MRVSLASIMQGVENAINPEMVAPATAHFWLLDGSEVWRYGRVNIITKSPHTGGFRLDSGGMRTKAVKDRVCRYTPARLRQISGLWHVGTVPFFDGMTVDSYGQPPAVPAVALLPYAPRVTLLKHQINDLLYVVDHYGQRFLPKPVRGVDDCWVCQTHAVESSVSTRFGNTMLFDYRLPIAVPVVEGIDRWHLEAHLDACKLTGTLLVNAMRWADHSDESIEYFYTTNRRGVFKQALRSYLYDKLGIPDDGKPNPGAKLRI